MMNAIKNATAADLPALKRFIAVQYHPRYILLNDAFFAWQYRDNPYNRYPEYAMKIIESEGKIFGCGGIIPTPMKVFDAQVIAGNFSNFMIDERARGFGLGAALMKEASRDFSLGYTTGYGLHTRAMYEKLGHWTDMGVLRRFIRILRVGNLRHMLGRTVPRTRSVLNLRSERVQVQDITRFGPDIDAFWDAIKGKYPITINRDCRYLNWRYADHPLFTYKFLLCRTGPEIKGYAVYRFESCEDGRYRYTISRIIDFICEDAYEKHLIGAVVRDSRLHGADFIDFFFSGDFHTRSLAALGFVEDTVEPYTEIPLLFSPLDRTRKHIPWIVYFSEYPKSKTRCINPNHWYVTKGDGDQDRPNIPSPAHYV